MQIAILLGAGFSRWSCGLPLVWELFDFEIKPDNLIEERRIARLKEIYNEWKIAHPNKNNEAFIELTQVPDGKFSLVNWYITRRLTDPFVVNHGRRYTWYINSYHPNNHEGIQKARSVFNALLDIQGVEKLSVITTNYDLIVEYALGTRGFHYGVPGEQIGYTPYPYPKPLHVTGNVPIAKLHGSISWDSSRKYPDSRCGLTGKCLIVPPVSEKKSPPPLKNQWATAKFALSLCDKLVVFGFAFNDYDSAIRHFIAKSLRPTSDIIFVDIADHRKRLQSLLKNHDMKYIDAVAPEMLTGLSSWLKQ